MWTWTAINALSGSRRAPSRVGSAIKLWGMAFTTRKKSFEALQVLGSVGPMAFVASFAPVLAEPVLLGPHEPAIKPQFADDENQRDYRPPLYPTQYTVTVSGAPSTYPNFQPVRRSGGSVGAILVGRDSINAEFGLPDEDHAAWGSFPLSDFYKR